MLNLIIKINDSFYNKAKNENFLYLGYKLREIIAICVLKECKDLFYLNFLQKSVTN
jgi:hypothetical protein